ncbi:MAG: transcriptional regulator with XRE-family HTH domain [Rickettsiales bacterium]|jgi:transcriptional regulator with XRE-family HTH domain
MEKEEFVKKLGIIVREHRKKKGISIDELAFKTNVTYTTVSCLERGIAKDLKAFNLYKLVKNLNIDPSLIFNEYHGANKDKLILINKISSLDNKDLKGILDSLKKLTD